MDGASSQRHPLGAVSVENSSFRVGYFASFPVNFSLFFGGLLQAMTGWLIDCLSFGKGLSSACRGSKSGRRLSATDLKTSDAPEIVPEVAFTGCQPVFSVPQPSYRPVENS